MRVVLKTNDPVVLSYARHLLGEAGIGNMVLDSHVSAVEGSIGAVPRRLVVSDEDEAAARAALEEIDDHLARGKQ